MTDSNVKTGAPLDGPAARYCVACAVPIPTNTTSTQCAKCAMKAPAPKPISSRQCCRLCTCEGVQGTVLCKDHLEGFEYACHYLAYNGNGPLAQLLLQTIEQRKADDNG